MGWFGEKAKCHPKKREKNNLCTTRPALLVKIANKYFPKLPTLKQMIHLDRSKIALQILKFTEMSFVFLELLLYTSVDVWLGKNKGNGPYLMGATQSR